MEFVWLGLLAIVAMLLGPIAFFGTLGHSRRLRELESGLLRLRNEIEALKTARVGPAPAAAAQTTPTPMPAPPVAEAPAQPAVAKVAPAPAEEPRVAMGPVFEDAPSARPPSKAPVETPPPPPAPPAAPDSAKPPASPRPKLSLEESLGARWTVWVGGVAVALGALLLVRYSIEQGVFGPGARVVLGLLLALALVGGGEYLRRRDRTPTSGSNAYIPGVLTGAGTIAAFGSVYAAHALYGFIGPGVAFVALGLVGVGAMLAAILHGPALAGLGLLGSLAAPLLVTSDRPQPWPVVIYVAVVVATSYVLARARRWLWLALSAAAGGALWSATLDIDPSSADFYHAALVCLVVQTALAAVFLAIQPYRDAPDATARFDMPASAAFAALTLVALLIFHIHNAFETNDIVWIIALLAVVAALVVAGVQAAPVAAAAAFAGVLAWAALLYWPAAGDPASLDFGVIMARWAWPAPADPVRFIVLSLALALAPAALIGKRLLDGPELTPIPAAIYAGAATLTPLGILAIADLRLAEGRPSWSIAAAGAVLGALFAAAATASQARLESRESPATRLALGAATAASIAALAAGLVFALDGAALTVALALGALATAYASTRIGVPILRWCVAAIGVAVAGRLAWEPRIVGAALSPTPIFNWLLFGYGAPAVAFGLAARWMRRERDDIPVRVADSLAVLFSAFLFFFEIRHLTNHGDPFARGSGLVEQALLTTSSFGFAIVLTRLDAYRANVVFRWASLIAGALGIVFGAAELLLIRNPFFDAIPVEGGLVVNALLLAYLLPAALAGGLSYYARARRPFWYWAGAGALAGLLALGYGGLQLREFFHGPTIGFEKGFTLAELGLEVSMCLVLALAATLVGGDRKPFARATQGFWLLSAVVGLIGLAGFVNPFVSGDPIAGGAAFNTLLVAYALPGLLTLALAMIDRRRPAPAIGAAATVAAILWAFAYATLETRRVFQGDAMGWERETGNGEGYAYSAVWLALGLALLSFGVWRGSREARYASAFFIVATTLKVFLFDLAGLEGVLRAFSFLGLGAALIGIGLVYQKLVFARAPSAEPDPP